MLLMPYSSDASLSSLRDVEVGLEDHEIHIDTWNAPSLLAHATRDFTVPSFTGLLHVTGS
jgi:hypothetical protein